MFKVEKCQNEITYLVRYFKMSK